MSRAGSARAASTCLKQLDSECRCEIHRSWRQQCLSFTLHIINEDLPCFPITLAQAKPRCASRQWHRMKVSDVVLSTATRAAHAGRGASGNARRPRILLQRKAALVRLAPKLLHKHTTLHWCRIIKPPEAHVHNSLVSCRLSQSCVAPIWWNDAATLRPRQTLSTCRHLSLVSLSHRDRNSSSTRSKR